METRVADVEFVGADSRLDKGIRTKVALDVGSDDLASDALARLEPLPRGRGARDGGGWHGRWVRQRRHSSEERRLRWEAENGGRALVVVKCEGKGSTPG